MRQTLLAVTVGVVALAGTFVAVANAPIGLFADRTTDLAGLTLPLEKPASVMRPNGNITDLRNGFRSDNGQWCEFKRVKVFDHFHAETFYVDEKVCL